MARKVKKLNRKMKKSIRRTIASVMLITSLVVAAIPVPENVASVDSSEVGESGTGTVSSAQVQYPATVTSTVDETDADGNSRPYETTTSFQAVENGQIGDEAKLALPKPAGATVHKTYAISDLGGGVFRLDQIFSIWIDTKDTKGVIFDYNTTYQPKNMTLEIPNNVVTKYKKFTEGEVTTYYSNDDMPKLQTDYNKKYPEVDGPDKDEDGKPIKVPQKDVSKLTGDELFKVKLEIYTFIMFGAEFSPIKVMVTSSPATYEYFLKDAKETFVADEGGEYNIKAVGDYAFSKSGSYTSINIKQLNLAKGIIQLGNGAFKGVSRLESISLEEGITKIGNHTFENCNSLQTIEVKGNLSYIGVEAFKNCVSLQAINFPHSVLKVYDGAFANCTKLADADMSKITAQDSVIGSFAFYNCTGLNTVVFSENSKEVGTAAFAVPDTSSINGSWKKAELSDSISILGDSMFDGRTTLEEVILPSSYGKDVTSVSKLDEGFFRKCMNLKYVKFAESSKYATFATQTFQDVETKDFYVEGPATITGTDIDNKDLYAKPRASAHAAKVTYKFTVGGKEYYEVGDEDSNYNRVDSDGVIVGYNPALANGDIKLIIPKNVGNVKVTGIAEGCYNNIKTRIVSLYISDDSLSSIGASAFKDCINMKSAIIGNSVNSIGNDAFAGCKELKEVRFNTPADYSKFTIGDGAFATKSNELTFFGDIVKGYAPFEWAMSEDNYMDVTNGKRVCYRSQTADAENEYFADNLMVMYDNSAKEVVMLDYPKYSLLDEKNATYIKAREQYFLDKYESTDYDDERAIYEQALIDNDKIKQDEYDKPWNRNYFTRNRYSIINNYEEGGNNEWQTLNPYESKLVDACLNIEIPKGVTSIDVFGFYNGKENGANWLSYMKNKADDESIKMYTENQESQSQIAGLFSGSFKDVPTSTRSTTGSDIEKEVKGNDYVKSIVLNDVKKLPKYAFDSCEALESVTLGEALTELGTTPFRGCTNTTSVVGNSKYTCTNGIIYSKNADDSLTIEECLASRGDLVGEPALNSQFDPDLLKVSNIRESAFEDCVGLRTVTLTDITKLTTIPKKAFKNCVNLTTVDLPETIRTIAEEAFAGDKSIRVKIIGKEVNIATSAFEHNKGVTIISYENSAAERYAKYHDITFEPIGSKVKVTFLDYDGTILKEEKVESGGSATPPSNPKRDNYTFTGWKGTYKEVKEDSVVLAQYNPNANSGSGSGSGGSGSDSNKDDDDDDDDNSGNSSSSKSKLYTVIVANGTGGGTYKKGTTVTITANSPSTGKVFDRWETSSVNVSLNDVKKVTTSFKMPGNDVKVTAVYKNEKPDDPSENDSNKNNNTSGNTNTSGSGSGTGTGTGSGSGSGSSGSGSSGSGGSSNSNQNNGSSAVVTTPGISNTDKATVTVDGSTDNFVVKISESAEATAAVERALLNEFGSLDNIRYFPMDISLYDSSGVSKIEDTSGLTVNITMPIPDALVTYAGNNKAGAVIGEDTLEKLDAKFKTIDGVSCISFKATHFSPYTVYVDTSNLTASMDDSPKTGDGIHPKWFLSLGLACLSIVLFMKKDKSIKAKLA